MKSFQKLFTLTLFTGAVLNLSSMLSTDAIIKNFVDWFHRCCEFIFADGKIPVAFYLLASLHLLVLILFITRVVAIVLKTYDKVSSLLKKKSQHIPAFIQNFSSKHKVSVFVVDEKQPLAFSYGWFQPKIVISTSLIEILQESEIQAVLQHEYYHCIKKDPLKMIFARSAAFALFFLPVLQTLFANYLIEKEIDADRYAIQHSGVKPLASALFKLMKMDIPTYSAAGTAGFAPNVMDARIEAIIQDKPVQLRIDLKDCILSIFALTAIILLAIYLVSAITMTHQMVSMATVPIANICNLISLR